MPRPKGLPKTGGRQKGSRNKHLRAAPEMFEQLSFNSLEVAISLINNESLDMQYRVGLLKGVMKYQFPQLRSVEQTGEDGHQVVLQG
ncbi:MAG: hypothetical protein H6625_07395 [Bdellovibrionaceae bacterium]|nr:hypothetical protein [Pseudobdellovibrionaceae bacterium]